VSSYTGLSPDSRRILAAVDRPPEGDCKASDLLGIHVMSQSEAAPVLGVSATTLHRRLGRGLLRLVFTLGDL